MSQTPRQVRLASEYTQLINLAARSDLVSVEPVDVQPGFPPEKYVVTFTCRGVTAVDRSGAPQYAELHRARIYLPSDFPLREPHVKWLTPVWHPNIEHVEPHAVCTNTPKGFWTRRPLADLVVMMGEMVQYKRYYARWERPFPVDREAAQWVRDHAEPRGLLGPGRPVDDRPLVRSRLARPESAFLRRPPGAPAPSGEFRQQRPSGRSGTLRRESEAGADDPARSFVTNEMAQVPPSELAKYAHPPAPPAAPRAPLAGPATMILPLVADPDSETTAPLEPESGPEGTPEPEAPAEAAPAAEPPPAPAEPPAPEAAEGADAPDRTEPLEPAEGAAPPAPEPAAVPEEPLPDAAPTDSNAEAPEAAAPAPEPPPARLVHGLRRRVGTEALPALPPQQDTGSDEHGFPRSGIAPTFFLPSVLGRRRSGPMPGGLGETPCRACGRPISAAAVFCPYCGATETRAPAGRPAAAKPPSGQVRRFCHWCGLTVSPVAAFCPHCGKGLAKKQ